jgi:hypothetical protein
VSAVCLCYSRFGRLPNIGGEFGLGNNFRPNSVLTAPIPAGVRDRLTATERHD